jgi:hypothetical protein
LYARPLITAFTARIRRYCEFTVALDPVDHEFEGQSTNGNAHVLNARVIESPVDAIDAG